MMKLFKNMAITSLPLLLLACLSAPLQFTPQESEFFLKYNGPFWGMEAQNNSETPVIHKTVCLATRPENARIVLTRILAGRERKTTRHYSPFKLTYLPSDRSVYIVVSSPNYETESFDVKKINEKYIVELDESDDAVEISKPKSVDAITSASKKS